MLINSFSIAAIRRNIRLLLNNGYSLDMASRAAYAIAKRKYLASITNSSFIDEVQYDADNHTVLISMRRGSSYEYDDVSDREANQLLNANSKGRAYNAVIRNNHPWHRVR